MKLPDQLQFLENRNAIQHISTHTLKDKVILISGASSGIGKVSSYRLAKDGAKLILVGRNEEKLNQLKKDLEEKYATEVRIFIADYSRLESVNHCATLLNASLDKIDIIIHNAGIHSTKKIISQDGYELSFQINHLAHYLLTLKCQPLLLKSNDASILYINSEGHRFSRFNVDDYNFNHHHYSGLKGYGASKTAQLLSILALRKQADFQSIQLLAMHPGDVKSHIGENNGWLYRLFSHLIIQPLLRDTQLSANAIHALVSDPLFKKSDHLFYHLTIPEKVADHACDMIKAQSVLELSNTLLKTYL